MEIDFSNIDSIEIMVHAEHSEKSPIELEEVANPAEGVAVMDQDEYQGPEITLTVASDKPQEDENGGGTE